MADLVLDWELFGNYGTVMGASQTVDTGGVSVTVGFTGQDEDASAFTFNGPTYVAPGEDFDGNSALKLFGQGGEGGIDDTSTTTISFASSDDQYGDEVQDVAFRLNDIDADWELTPDSTAVHLDMITIRAYDADGNEVPVTLTLGSAVLQSGDALQGGADGWDPVDGEASVLVSIAGPVSRIEIDYDNGDTGEQRVMVSDIHFSTTEALVPDYIVEGDDDDNLIDVAYTGDPDGDMIDNMDNDPARPPQQDTVVAGGGDDTVHAGEGDDDVDGGTGDDVLYGEDGNDTLRGGDGSDTAVGGIGDDVIDTSGSRPAIDVVTLPGVPVDDDPEDDRDLVDAGDGNDHITTGDDRDTILAGDGDDTILSGLDDDVIEAGAGNDLIDDIQGSDSVDGGAGDDTILVGTDTFSDYVGDDPNLPIGTILSDPNTTDGMDTVDGGAGNDVIMTGDDADLIDGGTGDDTIHAGIDDDTVTGGEGHDSITGGHGSDLIFGNDGDDWINAGDSSLLWGQEPDATDPVPTNGMDTVFGGAGNDTIYGEDDDDSLDGGTGNDYIDGGIDEDTITGGDGADTIIGGDGADQLFGEAGRDTFIGGNAGDYVDGGDAPLGINPEDGLPYDYDTLDLRGSAPAGGRLEVTYTSADREDGYVEFYDADGNVTGPRMQFYDIENVVPCFTPGTAIATPKGERMVEELKEGDKIITRDNGIQEIRWIGQRGLTGHELARAPHLRPILIQKGSLGDNLPEHDILVSPQHRMLLTGDKTQYYFEDREVLAAAKHLTDLPGVDEVGTLGVTYIHFMFDQHEVVLSNGAWTESFQPGANVLGGMGAGQRDEILELFPDLKTVNGIKDYSTARRSLKKHEARLLVR